MHGPDDARGDAGRQGDGDTPTRRLVVRALAASGAVAALAACASGTTRPGSRPASGAPATSGGSTASVTATPTTTPPSPAPTPPASPRTPARVVPSRDEIVATYGDRRPTYWGLAAPGVVVDAGPEAAAAGSVVLTLDACGGSRGSGYDIELIELLRRHEVAATLFLNHRWVTERPGPARELAADPLFEVTSHGMRHLPLSVDGRRAYGIRGTRDVGEAYDELAGNTDTLEELTGAPVRWFRPGTAYCDDVAAMIARDLGTPVVGFTVNGDGGATFAPAQVAAEVRRARPGDIVIAHVNQPSGGTAEGFARAIPRMLDAGTTFARLGDVLPGAGV